MFTYSFLFIPRIYFPLFEYQLVSFSCGNSFLCIIFAITCQYLCLCYTLYLYNYPLYLSQSKIYKQRKRLLGVVWFNCSYKFKSRCLKLSTQIFDFHTCLLSVCITQFNIFKIFILGTKLWKLSTRKLEVFILWKLMQSTENHNRQDQHSFGL